MKGFLNSFRFAFKGIRFGWQGRNFRIQCLIALTVVVSGFIFEISRTEWLSMLIIIGLVLSFEIMNTAIEHLVNLISPEFNPLAGKIKDLAAGAVLVLSIIAAGVGLIIFFPRLLELF
jgi:diacylglycerol kinase (ATP)